MVTDTITIIVQVNGKLRAKLDMPADSDEDMIKNLALENDNVKVFVADKKPSKIIYVKDRLVNIVV
jgi:leucyl-tRNA synthetase